MEQYIDMASVYDRLMDDVDYSGWVDYLTQLMDRMGFTKGGILELGCGTGNITLDFARRGYDICGLDISQPMLAIAEQKAREEGAPVIFFNQSMELLSLNAKFSAVIAPCDGLNYLRDKKALRQTIRRVKKHLSPGGIFIFDISSIYKLSTVLGNNTFTRVEDDISYIWENSYSPKNNVVEMDITFFVKEGDLYRRFEEYHRQRSYTIEDIKAMLMEEGFSAIKVYGNFRFSIPKDNDERIHFVCRT